jgi:hypothetical protein
MLAHVLLIQRDRSESAGEIRGMRATESHETTDSPKTFCLGWANVALVSSGIDTAREALIFFPQFAAPVA